MVVSFEVTSKLLWTTWNSCLGGLAWINGISELSQTAYCEANEGGAG